MIIPIPPPVAEMRKNQGENRLQEPFESFSKKEILEVRVLQDQIIQQINIQTRESGEPKASIRIPYHRSHAMTNLVFDQYLRYGWNIATASQDKDSVNYWFTCYKQ